MAQIQRYTHKDVNDVADAVMKNPGVPVDSTNFPDGMEQDVVNEINAREQHHKDVQSAIDKMTPDQASAASSQHSVVDDQGKDMDPDHSAPMAGLLGASDSLTLGHTDELAGLIGALDGHGYDNVRNAVREKQHYARENHPAMYHGMGLLGATQLPGPKGSGVALGSIAGEGYSEKPLQDTHDDAMLGGAVGAVAEPLIGGAIGLVKRGASALAKSMAGDFWDPVLMRALFPKQGGSDAITELGMNDSLADNPGFTDVQPGTGEVADVVRENSRFPYLSPQGTKDRIAGVVHPSKGSAVNVPRGAPGNPMEPAPPWKAAGPIDAVALPPPGGRGAIWTPQAGPPKEINLGGGDDYESSATAQNVYQNASTDDLNGIMSPGPAASVPTRRMPMTPAQQPENVSLQSFVPPSEIPPLSPAERIATQGLTNMSDAPSNGMDPSSLIGGLSRMIQKNIVGPTAIGIPKAGQAMLRYLDSNPSYGASAATLKGIINHVMSSTDPSFSDYLAKETFPEYLALSLKAEKEADNGRR